MLKSGDHLSEMKRLLEKNVLATKNRISAILLFNSHQIRVITGGRSAKCLSLTARGACIWLDGDESQIHCETCSNYADDKKPSTQHGYNGQTGQQRHNRRRLSTSSGSYLPDDYEELDGSSSDWHVHLANWVHRRLGNSVHELVGTDFRWISHSLFRRLQDEFDRLGEHRIVDSCQTIERACPSLRLHSSLTAKPAVFPMTGFPDYCRKVKERIERCWPCESMRDVEWLIITSVDEICWLFDLKDLPFVFCCNWQPLAILGPCPKLFIDCKPSKALTEAMLKEVAQLEILPGSGALSWIADLCGRVAITSRANEAMHRALQAAKCVLIEQSPVAQTMGRRSPDERDALQELHEQDSAVVCWFLYSISCNAIRFLCIDTLTSKRGHFDDFSHDKGTVLDQVLLNGYLLRSTAKYFNGISMLSRLIVTATQHTSGTSLSTSLNSTMANANTDEVMHSYTQSVRSFLRLINTPFPAGKTTGAQLDAIAVRHLCWVDRFQPGANTGHPIGLYAFQDWPAIGSSETSHILEEGNVFYFNYSGKFSQLDGCLRRGSIKRNVTAASCVMVVKADEIPTTVSLTPSNRESPSLDDTTVSTPNRDSLSDTVYYRAREAKTQWLQCRPLTLVPFSYDTLQINQFSDVEIRYLHEYNCLCYELLYERIIRAFGDSDGCIGWFKRLTSQIGDML